MSQAENNQEQSGITAARSKLKRRVRRILLFIGPLAVAIAATVSYLAGGRLVETDNAYVQADKVLISAEVAGPVVAVAVAENQEVEKGAVLFALDDRPYAIAVEQTKAKLQEIVNEIATRKASLRQKQSELVSARHDIDFTDREFQRQSSLDLSRAVPKAKLDEAEHALTISRDRSQIIQAEIEQILARLQGNPDIANEQLASFRLAKADLDQALLRLERTVVRAPFAGRVSKIPSAGLHVEAGTAVMSLIALDGCYIEANVKETEMTHIQPGQEVQFEVDTYPGIKWRGRVKSISQATGNEFSIIPAQNATGNWVKVVQRIPVRIAIDETDPSRPLRAGMSVVVNINTRYQRPMPAFVRNVVNAYIFNSPVFAEKNTSN